MNTQPPTRRCRYSRRAALAFPALVSAASAGAALTRASPPTRCSSKVLSRRSATSDNSDINPDVYNGVSRANVVDAQLLWRPSDAWQIGLDVDNVTNEKYWEAHPIPQCMFVGELRWQGGAR